MAKTKNALIKQSANSYPGMSPLNNSANHEMLVEYLKSQLDSGSEVRDALVTRMEEIDKQVSGFSNLDNDDKQRHKDNVAGKAPKPVKHNLPLTQAQLDEAATFFLSVFAPEGNLFEAVAQSENQSIANGLAQYVNEQGERAQYYRHLSKGLSNMLKYNLGGWFNNWEQDLGTVFKANPDGTVKKEEGVVWEGNRMFSIDMYNFIWDTSVHPVDLPHKGEFFAMVSLKKPFAVHKMAKEKRLFDTHRFLRSGGSNITPGQDTCYYKEKPKLRHDSTSANKQVDWGAFMSGRNGELTSGIELVDYIGWLVPSEFGLSTSKELELWHIALVNSKFIGFHQKLEDTHGMLPCAFGSPAEDDNGIEQRTYAEQLIPLQNFASFLLNTHQDATRKAIYGVTVYNPNVFPGLDKEHGDLIAAKIPMRTTSYDKDLNKSFYQFNDAPQTAQNVQQVGQIMEVMQKILPTDMLKQVAGLERATLYQAAATVQASNRRNYKIARVIASQAITPLKQMMMYNIFGNLKTFDYRNEEGVKEQASVSTLVNEQVELDIGSGLKGIDRLMIVQTLRDILQFVLQSQAALAEIDVLRLLNYYTSVAGDRTNLNQFRKTPEQKEEEMLRAQAGQKQLAQTGGT